MTGKKNNNERSHLTVLLVLRENLAHIDVVPSVDRHREATLFTVHDLLRREVLIELEGFLRRKK
jgi:hypothetical protein